MSHRHYTTGLPCDCGFTAHLSKTTKTAGKLHDFLMNPRSRPDLQTPEGQAFLKHLETHYHNEKTDALMPWLAREWKRGQISYMPELDRHDRHPVLYHAEGRLAPRHLDHWADFLQSRHPVRRELGDIMQHDVGSFQNHIDRWDRAMEEAAQQQALQGGQVVHTTPDNWSVRQLTTPEELKAEGDAMGHCVGGYHGAVARGDSLIYSLRSPEGQPHATVEIRPRYVDWHGQRIDRANLDTSIPVAEGDDAGVSIPNSGGVVQIQGKSNREPLDEYKARLADWFRSFGDDRPTWQYDDDDEDSIADDEGYHHSSLDHPDLIPLYQERNGGRLAPSTESTEDAYGIVRPPASPLPADYDELLKNIHMYDSNWDETRPDPAHLKSIYLLAKERGEIPELAKALEGYQETQDNNFHEWMDMNYESAPRYPDPSLPHGWEDEEGDDTDEGQGKPYWEPEGSQGERYYDEESAEEAYEKAYGQWEQQHGGLYAANQMYGLLQPHYGTHPETGEQGYWNEVAPEPQSGPQPPTTAKTVTHKQAMPLIPTKWDALQHSMEEYMGPEPKFPGETRGADGKITPEYDAWLTSASPLFQARRERRDEWEQAARSAMATGRMTPEQVVALGYRPQGHEGTGEWSEPKWGKWQPLPERLYHVTTNVPAIAAEGRLRSPYELDHEKSRGLGSYGRDKTISFTDSLEEAQNIRKAMLEGADVASGRLPIERLVEMARTGEGANEPWLEAIFGDHDWSKGNPKALDDLLLGREPFYRHKLPEGHPLKEMGRSSPFGIGGTLSEPEWAQHGFYPYKDAAALGQPGNPVYTEHSVYRNLSPQEKAKNAFEWWRNPWAPMRSWRGGPPDPLFAATDPDWFANLDPSHVGIVETQPVPGAHGYPMGSLNEWRVPTGEAVNITGINGQPYVPPTTSYTKTASLYQRWAFSPATGQVELADNDGDPLDVRYHTDLARELNEPNLVHGYAYPINGGWRLFDWDSKPLTDPYIIAQVMRQLKASEARREPQGASWDPDYEGDWDRVHLGLPS